MNLLPRPRSVSASGETTALRPAVVQRDSSIPPQGYRLTITPDHVEIVAADDPGEFYARATLEQLERAGAGTLPVCEIEDWPDLPVRGVMLDISRNKVPTMATLEALIDRLASWKVNQVQLYMEHTFAYRDHEEAWRDASPLGAEEVQALDAFCRARHVELVPNQNCLGHFERWLRHDTYRPLALAPDGYEQDGRRRPPSTLDPRDPDALALVRSLLDELLPNFDSHRVHVGLDEPWELPDDAMDDYLAWIQQLRALPDLAGHEMLIWGDILADKPGAIAALPDDVTVCEWGYDDWHPFDARARALSAAGRPFWVCPGTSSWLTLIGRWTNVRETAQHAMRAALDHGGVGFLNTDWGDQGHLQYLPISEPGFAYGAAVSWCLETNADLDGDDMAAALDVHVFDDNAGELGGVLLALGDLHRTITPQFPNMSTLVLHLYYPQLHVGRSFTKGINDDELAGTQAILADVTDRLGRAKPQRADGALVVQELRTAVAMVDLLCRDARARLRGNGSLESIVEVDRKNLSAELTPLIDAHRALWLARNRPGGLRDSVAWLEHLRHCYDTGTADPQWGGW